MLKVVSTCVVMVLASDRRWVVRRCGNSVSDCIVCVGVLMKSVILSAVWRWKWLWVLIRRMCVIMWLTYLVALC